MLSTKYFPCVINIKKIPMKLQCFEPKNSLVEAESSLDKILGEPIERNKSYISTTIPLCSLFPEFVNTNRALRKAKNNLVE